MAIAVGWEWTSCRCLGLSKAVAERRRGCVARDNAHTIRQRSVVTALNPSE